MTSATKNIVAGVLAFAAILGVAALFVNVTRSRGSREGEVEEVEEEEERAIWGRSLFVNVTRSRGSREGEVEEEKERTIWGRSLEEKDAPFIDNNGGLVEKSLVKGPEAGDRISPNETHERKLWVRHDIEPPDEHPAPQS